MAAFSPSLFAFLTDLAAHNERDWFVANKKRFEVDVKAPLHAFVLAFAPRMEAVDPEARCDDKSVFRIYRDTRFSADKTPYKTHAAAQFGRGHEKGPAQTGYYLHLEPGGCFFAAGLWMPSPSVAAQIRAAIDRHQDSWHAAKETAGGLGGGGVLVRVPKPYGADHPYADDLRRKSFTASVRLTDAEVVSDAFLDRAEAAARQLAPLVRFLADAVGQT